LNSGLTAIAVGLDARESPIQIWRRHFQGLAISYLSIPIAPGDVVAGHEVLQRIHQSRHEPDMPREPVADVAGGASTNRLAFMSLTRAAGGEACVADVLALGRCSWPT
jgi:hypothetical protein